MPQMPERLSRTTLYESDYICLYADRVRLPSGAIIEKYHQLHYPHEAVAIVLFRGEQEILFIHNRRYTLGHPEWEIPAGKVDPGESIEAAAAREAMEESGCKIRHLRYLCSQNPANGMSDAVVHVFAADVAEESALTDGDEVCEKKWLTRQEALHLLQTNDTKDGVTMLAVLYALQFDSPAEGERSP